jgi:uncharacterized protein YecT (DUF1311 family)
MPCWFFRALVWVFIALIVVAIVVKHAHAQQRELTDCQVLAELINAAADFRDTDAKLDLVVQMALDRLHDTPTQKAVLEREIRRMWIEGLPANDAAFSVWRRCQKQMGDMGVES